MAGGSCEREADQSREAEVERAPAVARHATDHEHENAHEHATTTALCSQWPRARPRESVVQSTNARPSRENEHEYQYKQQAPHSYAPATAKLRGAERSRVRVPRLPRRTWRSRVIGCSKPYRRNAPVSRSLRAHRALDDVVLHVAREIHEPRRETPHADDQVAEAFRLTLGRA
jgi:hypothetical protein